MKKLFLFTIGLSFLLTSCKTTPELNNNQNVNGVYSFTPDITKASDLDFENGDQISIHAYNQNDEAYASNVKYTYADGVFTSSEPIEYNPEGLTFRALYPYDEVDGMYSNGFTVMTDQTSHENYTASDLMAASSEFTTDLCPKLKFSHLLTKLVFVVNSTDVSMDNAKVNVSAQISTSAEDMQAFGDVATVTAFKNEGLNYKALVAPQTIAADANFISVDIDGEQYTWAPNKEVVLESGKQYTLKIDIKDGEMAIGGSVNQ